MQMGSSINIAAELGMKKISVWRRVGSSFVAAITLEAPFAAMKRMQFARQSFRGTICVAWTEKLLRQCMASQ
jgi:5-enolpyruvylshikimate-3-phosphate synthase